MSKTNTFENDWLRLVFHGETIEGIAQNDATSPITQLWVSLHTADPGEGGNQESSEASYSGYARQNVVRSSSGWSISGNTVSPVSDIQFDRVSADTGLTATHVGIGTAESGTGKLLYVGKLTPGIPLEEGFEPTIDRDSVLSEN